MTGIAERAMADNRAENAVARRPVSTYRINDMSSFKNVHIDVPEHVERGIAAAKVVPFTRRNHGAEPLTA
jgi:hypothetical protein